MARFMCEHRHTIKEHPACFAKGRILDKYAREYERIEGKPWYTHPGYKVGYVDIEVDNLKADRGTMLSWAVKEKGEGGAIYASGITRDELFNGESDKRLVSDLVDVLRDFSIIVGYYSTRFDVPFIRTRALKHGISALEYGSLYHFDLYFTVRHKLNMSSNSLGRACDFFGLKQKTHEGPDVWEKAKYGDPDAMEKILEYNINDVVITEQLHDLIHPFRKWTRKSA